MFNIYIDDEKDIQSKLMSYEFYKPITESFKSGKLFLFIGAGFSYYFNIKTWKSVVEDIIDNVIKIPMISEDEQVHDYLKSLSHALDKNCIDIRLIISYIYNLYLVSPVSKDVIYEIIKDTFRRSNEDVLEEGKIGESQRRIVDLMGVTNLKYITTNFDNILEIITGFSNWIDSSNFDGLSNKTTNTIIHLHGYIDEKFKITDYHDRITFDFNSYLEHYYSGKESLISKIANKIDKSTILFIGSSMQEIEIIGELNKIVSSNSSNLQLFALKDFYNEKMYTAALEFYKKYKINIVGYNTKLDSEGCADFSLFQPIIIEILQLINAIQSPKQKVQLLSKVEIENAHPEIRSLIEKVEDNDLEYSRTIFSEILNIPNQFQYFDNLKLFEYNKLSKKYMFLLEYLIMEFQNRNINKTRLKEIIKANFKSLKDDTSYYYYYYVSNLNHLLINTANDISFDEFKYIFECNKKFDVYLYDVDLMKAIQDIDFDKRKLIYSIIIKSIISGDINLKVLKVIDEHELIDVYIDRLNDLPERSFLISSRDMMRLSYSFERKLFRKIVELFVVDIEHIEELLDKINDSDLRLKVLFACSNIKNKLYQLINKSIDNEKLKELIDGHKFYYELLDYFRNIPAKRHEEVKQVILNTSYNKVAEGYIDYVKNKYLLALANENPEPENEDNFINFRDKNKIIIQEILDSTIDLKEIFDKLSKTQFHLLDYEDMIHNRIIHILNSAPELIYTVDINIFSDYKYVYFDLVKLLMNENNVGNIMRNIIKFISVKYENYELLWNLKDIISYILENDVKLNSVEIDCFVTFIRFSFKKLLQEEVIPNTITDCEEFCNFFTMKIKTLLEIYFRMYNIIIDNLINFYEILEDNKNAEYIYGYLALYNYYHYSEITENHIKGLKEEYFDYFIRGYITRQQLPITNELQIRYIQPIYSKLINIAVGKTEREIVINFYWWLFVEKKDYIKYEEILISEEILNIFLINYQDFDNDEKRQLIELVRIVINLNAKYTAEILNRFLYCIENRNKKEKYKLFFLLPSLMKMVNSYEESWIDYHLFITIKNFELNNDTITVIEEILDFIQNEKHIDNRYIRDFVVHLKEINNELSKALLEYIRMSPAFSYYL